MVVFHLGHDWRVGWTGPGRQQDAIRSHALASAVANAG
jgi:hypothetical protein